MEERERERIWLNAGPLTAVKASYRLIHEKKAGGHVDFVDTHVDTEKKDTMDVVKSALLAWSWVTNWIV